VDVPYFDEVVLAKDLGIPHFEGSIFKYSLLEAVTSIKPKFLRTLFDRYPDEQNVVFMDTDIIAYAPFDDLLAALEHHSILLTPHRIEPNPEPLGYLHRRKPCAFSNGGDNAYTATVIIMLHFL
jgi:hypothetical protein